MTEPLLRYFAYINNSVNGPFYANKITQLPGFGRNTLVCAESELGRWREACRETAFDLFFGNPAQDPQKPMFQLAHVPDEGAAVRSLLEKAILKNSQLETEVKSIKRDYSREKKKFEEEIRKKDREIQALFERLKKISAAQNLQREHPSWEQLYKTLKKRGDEKLFEAAQELSEKKEEILRLKEQMQNLADKYEDAGRKTPQNARQEMTDADARLKEPRSEAEEKN